MGYIDSIHSLAQTIDAGTILFEEGTAGGGIIVLLSGRLVVRKGGYEVGVITEPGSYVGESTFVTGSRRSATVVADTSATIIRLSAQQSADFLQTREAETKILKTVTQRLNAANQYIQEHGDRIQVLEDALREVLLTLKAVHEDISETEDETIALQEAARKVRVVVNKFGRAELVTEPIVI